VFRAIYILILVLIYHRFVHVSSFSGGAQNLSLTFCFDENSLSVYGLVVGCLNDMVYFLETDSAFLGEKTQFSL
jgi:hypothetical protein